MPPPKGYKKSAEHQRKITEKMRSPECRMKLRQALLEYYSEHGDSELTRKRKSESRKAYFAKLRALKARIAL
jgi:hypothetical protein